MSFKFKPEDFIQASRTYFWHSDLETIIETANSILQAHLATLPKAYRNLNTASWGWSMNEASEHTHQCVLWGITEIEKIHECAPDYSSFFKTSGLMNATCVNCGVKLKAKWEKA